MITKAFCKNLTHSFFLRNARDIQALRLYLMSQVKGGYVNDVGSRCIPGRVMRKTARGI